MTTTIPRLPTSIGRSPVVQELAAVAASVDFVAALRRSERAAATAAEAPDQRRLVAELVDLASTGGYAAVLAIESLGAIAHEAAGEALVGLLSDPRPVARRHAAWRLGARPPALEATGPLLELVQAGGIDTLHAHRTLRRWAATEPGPVARAARVDLGRAVQPLGRARLIDLLGWFDDEESAEVVRRIAADDGEPIEARVAAIRALETVAGGRNVALLRRLAVDDDDVAAHAALALESCSPPGPETMAGDRGLRVAQLVLAGGLDGQLSLGGRGDTGGVASLLVSLGAALARRDEIERVLTIGRGAVGDALLGPPIDDPGTPSFGMIAVGVGERAGRTPDELWEQVPTIEREIARVLRAAGPVDVLHLRMADAGTLAGAAVAAELGIPICFSVAPDPHNVIQSLQSRGELDHRSFVDLDTEQHVWFRARLVEKLARRADRLALFPRRDSRSLLTDLGLDAADDRAAVVAEGIDLDLLRRAEQRPHPAPTPRAMRRDAVAELADRIPPHRRGLPLLVSVGRLHPVKGMERVVAAWGADPALHAACNLVIVGGDLDDPSGAERAVLAAIDEEVPPDDPRRAGLVLLGGRPRSDVARLLVAATSGVAGRWPGGGVYVDGALKEEFGLAVLEALAAGLVVVAPSTGGPPTYVADGDTGVLVDPGADLARAVRSAFDLVGRPGRRARARRMVEERYSVATMAEQLSRLYEPSAVAA